MNYATDRLDRRSRSRHGLEGLYRDFRQALRAADAAALARVALQRGACRGAVHHAAVAWARRPEDPLRAADYAQMCEFAGYPEVGMLALLCFRIRGRLGNEWSTIDEAVTTFGSKASSQPKCMEEWLNDSVSCGCGIRHCGDQNCVVPFADDSIQEVLDLLQLYLLGCNQHEWEKTQIPTAHEILKRRQKQPVCSEVMDDAHIPAELRFWDPPSETNTLRSLPVVVQTLLIKLLYLTIPCLAVDALLHSAPSILQDDATRLWMVQQHKSHLAYLVLMDAMAFGSPHALVKPARRHAVVHYHVPLYDQLHGLDIRRDFTFSKLNKDTEQQSQEQPSDGERCLYTDNAVEDFVTRLKHVVEVARTARNDHITLAFILPRMIEQPSVLSRDAPPLFLVGDSHVLSLGWQLIQLPSGDYRRVVPVVVTGLKAWHVRRETRFFTKDNLITLLNQRLPTVHTILFSAGEIDCREGLGGPLLEGYEADDDLIKEHVQRTVQEYVDALADLTGDKANSVQQILALPVAPHAAKATSRVLGQESRRETTRVWNGVLRDMLPANNIYYLDYSDGLIDRTAASYTLLPAFNADSTHMNSAFVSLLEKSVANCGCDLNLL